MDASESGWMEYVNALKKFRPAQTVLEMEGSDIGSKRAVWREGTMKEKRSLHDHIIQNRLSQQSQQAALASQINASDDEPWTGESQKNRKKKKTSDFRDQEFFIDPFPKNMHREKGLSVKAGEELKGDVAMDVLGDESEELKHHCRTRRWDRKRKKFVHVNDLKDKNQLKASKRLLKNESGAFISADARAKKGLMVKQWSDKTKQRIPIAGEEEEVKPGARENQMEFWRRMRYRHRGAQQQTVDLPELKTKEQIHKERKRAGLSKKKSKQRKKRKNNRNVDNNARTRSRIVIRE